MTLFSQVRGSSTLAIRPHRTHIPLSEGESVWIGNRELVTFEETGKDTGGQFALVEVVGLSGSGPPPHIHHSADEVYCLLDGERTFTASAGSVFHTLKGTLHAGGILSGT